MCFRIVWLTEKFQNTLQVQKDLKWTVSKFELIFKVESRDLCAPQIEWSLQGGVKRAVDFPKPIGDEFDPPGKFSEF